MTTEIRRASSGAEGGAGRALLARLHGRTLDDVEIWARIVEAPEPETWRQRIGRLLHLPVRPAPVLARAHRVSQPFVGDDRRRARLAFEYGEDHVRRVLFEHYTGEEAHGPVRGSRMRPIRTASRVLAMKARA